MIRRTAALIGLAAALLLIAIGIWQPVAAEARWLALLWLAAPTAGLALRLLLPTPAAALPRAVANLGLVLLVGFTMLSLQLLRQQFVQSEAVVRHSVVAADGGVTANVRPVLESQRVLRGSIVDRRGRILVESQAVAGTAQRIYPIAADYDIQAFAHLLGFFSLRYGESGLESVYSDYLTGRRGSLWQQLQQRAVGGQPQGNDLTLTIDAELQARSAELLGGRTGSVVVLEPSSGAIRALVSAPSYDPRSLTVDPTQPASVEAARIAAGWAELNAEGAQQPLLNRATQGLYPPGSTFKALTAMAELEQEGLFGADQISCPAEYYPQDNAPPVVNARADLTALIGEPATFERVFAYSCNTAFAQYALRIGAADLARAAAQFGIVTPEQADAGEPLLRDLPAAGALLYVTPDFLSQPRALADTGYGQGELLVTPLHMALIAAATANDGVLMEPYLVQQIVRPDGTVQAERNPTALARVMSQETAAVLRSAMGAVAEYGFGSAISAEVPGVTVGGKSGTAEHAPGAAPHAWFIALAPLEQPRYAVAVMLEAGGEGSGAAAQLAGRVLAAAFAAEAGATP
jgi:penicillin-binding protein A